MSSPGVSERTVLVSAPAFHRSGKAWRDFRFTGLEKVTHAQVQLARRVEWLCRSGTQGVQLDEAVRTRLGELFEEEVRTSFQFTHVVSPKHLRKYLGQPGVLAQLAPLPHKARGFLEVELGLAHAAIDLLLGGDAEALTLRPLTDIEEGVMSYVVAEILMAMSPSLDDGLPKLRLEGMARDADDVQRQLADETLVAVLQLSVSLRNHGGHVRLVVPASVLNMVNPPAGPARRQWLAHVSATGATRLSAVRLPVRAEIGYAELSAAELAGLRERDVVLVSESFVRSDRGEPGRARLRVGSGHSGYLEAEVSVHQGRYRAQVLAAASGDAVEAPPAEPASTGENKPLDESSFKSEGAELLNDIPLSVAVELARVPMTAEEVAALKVGQVVELGRMAGEPVELSVNGKIVGRGELVEVEGQLGVRILNLAGS